MISEFGRITKNRTLRSEFNDTWKMQWLPQVVNAIKSSLTEPILKKMRPYIKADDLDDDDSEK